MGTGWMDEDDGPSAVQGRPDRLEAFVAKIAAVVVGLDGNAVRVEFVQGPCDLFETAFDVREGERGPEAEAVGHALFEARGVVVAVAAELAGSSVVAGHEVHAR